MHNWIISSISGAKVIKDFFKKEKIDGEIFCHEWKDFGHNRSLALAAAYQKSDYVLIFDADDEMLYVIENLSKCDIKYDDFDNFSDDWRV